MPLLEEIPVFAFRGKNASVNEVLAAAAVRGDLLESIRRFAWIQACAQAAEAEGIEVDQEAIEADVSAFRYAQDLISAEETETWLTARGLDAEQMADHFAAEQCFRLLKAKVPAPNAGSIDFDSDLLTQLAPMLFFNGSFGPLATALAQRLVAGPLAPATPSAEDLRRERRNFLHRSRIEERDVPGWLQAVGRNSDWLDHTLARELAFGIFAASVITPAGLTQALSTSRLPLTRVEVERAEFDTLDALREAELCVREDGMTLEQVAQESLFPFRRQIAFAGDLPAAERESFLFARLGDLLRVNSPAGDLQLARVILRSDPTVEDADVRSRLSEKILGAALAEAAGTGLHWIIAF